MEYLTLEEIELIEMCIQGWSSENAGLSNHDDTFLEIELLENKLERMKESMENKADKE